MNYFYFLLLVFLGITVFSQENKPLKEKAQTESDKGHYDNAIAIYTKLISASPSDYTNFLGRAECYQAKGQFRKVVADCSKALTFNMSINEKYYALYTRARAYCQYNQWKEAFRDLDSAIIVYYDYPGFLITRASVLYHLENYTTAIDECKAILKMQKIDRADTISIYYTLGLSYLRSDSINRSTEYAEKLFKMDSLTVSYLYLKAALYDTGDSIQKAADCYSTIIKLDSTDAHAYYCRGVMLNSLEAYDLAIKDLKRSSRMSENDFYSVHYQLGNAYSQLKKCDLAILYYKKCLSVEPKSSVVCNQIAWMYFLENKYGEGISYANKAIEFDTKNENAYDTRGAINYKLGKYDLAIKDFDSALSIDSLYSNSYYFRALCYIKEHEKAKACSDLETVQKHKEYKIKDGERAIEVLITENCHIK